VRSQVERDRGRANAPGSQGIESEVPQMHPKGARRSPSLQAHLRTAEVADLLHVHPKTVARWAKQGLLPYGRTLGGHRRFPETAIRDLAASLRQEVQG
jgi:excisionase family DNA binding protein